MFGGMLDSTQQLLTRAGISNSGKSTVLKQLHMMRGINPSPIELDEARNLIYSSLVKAFKYVWSLRHEVDFDSCQGDGDQSIGKVGWNDSLYFNTLS